MEPQKNCATYFYPIGLTMLFPANCQKVKLDTLVVHIMCKLGKATLDKNQLAR